MALLRRVLDKVVSGVQRSKSRRGGRNPLLWHLGVANCHIDSNAPQISPRNQAFGAVARIDRRCKNVALHAAMPGRHRRQSRSPCRKSRQPRAARGAIGAILRAPFKSDADPTSTASKARAILAHCPSTKECGGRGKRLHGRFRLTKGSHAEQILLKRFANSLEGFWEVQLCGPNEKPPKVTLGGPSCSSRASRPTRVQPWRAL